MYYAFIHIYKFFPTGVIIKIVFIKSSLSFHCKPKKTKGCTGWGLPVSPWFTVTDSKGVKRLKKWTVTTKFLTQTSRYSKWYKITASSKATQILLRMGTILAGGGDRFQTQYHQFWPELCFGSSSSEDWIIHGKRRFVN